MEKDPSGDLPPSYSQLIQSSTELTDHGTNPLVVNSFEKKNARVVFIQKVFDVRAVGKGDKYVCVLRLSLLPPVVLSIFLMQTVAIDLIFEAFLYVDIFRHHFDITGFLVGSCVLYLTSLALMIKFYQARRKPPFNYIILVYQPIAVSVISVFVMRAILGLSILAGDILEMVSLAWKAYIFTSPIILLYTVFCLDSRHEFRLRNCILIATGIFFVTFLFIMPYVTKFWNGPFAVFYINVVFYPIYLYILYDIDAMTKSDYHDAITPADYVNGAVNLSFDFFIIIRNFIRRKCSCCFVDHGENSTEAV